MNREQTTKATKLLGLLCDKGEIDGTEMYRLFESTKDAEFVCNFLKSKNLLWFIEAGGSIAKLKSAVETCNTFENNLLMKDLIENEQKREMRLLEVELAKSNIEANKLNAIIAKKNDKNKISNNIATWINVSIGIINLLVIIWQLWKAE